MNRFNRPVTGLILLFTAIFVVNARKCGLLGGVWLAKGLSLLLGTFGSSLLLFALVTCGLVMLVPWKLVAQLARRRPMIHPPVRTHSRRYVRTPPLHSAHREDDKNWSMAFAPIEPPRQPPAHRRKLDDVRGAMKSLGYKPHEYESVVAAMDPTLPMDRLLRDGIKAMQPARLS
jgi:hypothetical protein